MIIVDEKDLDFSGNLMTSLKGRGLECGLFSVNSDSFSSINEKTYVTSKSKVMNLRQKKNSFPF